MLRLLTKLAVLLLITAVELLLLEGAARVYVRSSQVGDTFLTREFTQYSKSFALPSFPGASMPRNDIVVARLPANFEPGEWTRLNEPPKGPVFVLAGGSAPYGHQIKYPDTFWAQIEKQFPGEVTFLNTAIPMSQVAQVGSQVQTDLDDMKVKAAFVYTGDNEWNGFSYQRLSEGSVLFRLDAQLLRSDFYKLLTYGVKSMLLKYQSYATARPTDEKFWFGLSDYCLQYPFREVKALPASYMQEFRKRLVEVFDANINLIISLARERGVPLVFLTSPIRYRLSPCWTLPQYISEKFSGQPAERELEEILKNGYQALKTGNFSLAKEIFLKGAAIDPDAVILNYFLGYTYEGLGDLESARKHFLLSRRMMIGSGGTIDVFNEVIRSKAGRGVSVIDLQTEFDSAAAREGQGLGDSYFMDWCHPTVEGHRVIAGAIQSTVEHLLTETRDPN